MKRIAVIVPTPDQHRPMSARCLEIVRATTANFDVQLLPIESSGPEFRISRSFNRGFRESPDADAWVLLNDDAWMDAGWLDAMVDAAAKHPDAGIIGAVLRFPDGKIQHAGGYLPISAPEYLAAGFRHRAPRWALKRIVANRARPDTYMYAHWHTVRRSHRLDFLTGACALITRKAREAVPFYDEDYTFGFEDIDHSLRVLDAGFELALATKATGVHHEGASGRPLSASMQAHEALFKSKWPVDRIRSITRRNGRRGYQV